MLNVPRWLRPLLALLALVLGYFSYQWAGEHPEALWEAPLMLMGAATLLALAWRGLPAALTAWWGALSSERRWLLGAALAVTLILLYQLSGPPRVTYLPLFLLWVTVLAAFAFAVAPPRALSRPDWGMWWEVNRDVALLITLIVVGALALRLWNVDTVLLSPSVNSLAVQQVLSGELLNPFALGAAGEPVMIAFYAAIGEGFLGATPFAQRLPWAVAGAATVLLLFWLVTRLHGVKVGLTAAALLAVYHYPIHLSRVGEPQVVAPLFLLLLLFFLTRGRDTDAPLDFLLAGVTVGVAHYFEAHAWLLTLVLGALLLYYGWLERARPEGVHRAGHHALVALAALLLTAAPMVQNILRFPNAYFTHLNRTGLLSPAWLEQVSVQQGGSITTLVREQVQRAFLMFTYYPDSQSFYGDGSTAMQGFWAALFMIGLLFCTLRLFPPASDSRYFPFVAAWWLGVVVGGLSVSAPPDYRQMAFLIPAAVYFIAVVLARMANFLQNALESRQRSLALAFLTLMLVVLAVSSLYWYFFQFDLVNVAGVVNLP